MTKSNEFKGVQMHARVPVDRIQDETALQACIARSGNRMLQVFDAIATTTGWRTSEVCGMKFSDISRSGVASVPAEKQRKAAGARAVRAYVELIHAKAVQGAQDAGDLAELNRLRNFTNKRIHTLTKGEHAGADRIAGTRMQEYAAELARDPEHRRMMDAARASAKVKSYSVKLPREVLIMVSEMHEAQLLHVPEGEAPVFIFASVLIQSSARTRQATHERHITRQTVWRWYASIREQLAADYAASTDASNQARAVMWREYFSPYSTRKRAAMRIYRTAEAAHPGSGLEAARLFLCHSTQAMTGRYLMLTGELPDFDAMLSDNEPMNWSALIAA